MARGHPAPRGSVLDSRRSAVDDLVSIGGRVLMADTPAADELTDPSQSPCVGHLAEPIPYVLTPQGRAYLAIERSKGELGALACDARASSGKPSQPQPSDRKR